MSAVVGALAEAWAEVRHHKLRVLLSLIGIALAVGAIAAVVAFSEYQKQAMAENSDREGGRQATLSISVSAGGSSAPEQAAASAPAPSSSSVDWDAVDAAFARVQERYGFSHTTRVADGIPLQIQTSDQVRPVGTRLVDPDWAVIHRAPLKDGRWLRASDADLLAPAVVISESLWEALGSPALADHPTVQLIGTAGGTAQVVGVTPKQYPGDNEKRMTMLYDSYRSRVDAVALPEGSSVNREVWVPPALAAKVGPILAADMRSAVGPAMAVSVSRTDWGSRPEMETSMVMFELVAGGIAGLVLLLGGLGLVNIQLVAMRQRIREIGIRRSFGATAGRIFTTVLLESVVATAVAGVFGIALAVVILRMPFVMQMFPMQDVPPFPLRAAFTALIAAVAIGALAGFIPALTAVRARVIDALRF